MKDITPTNYDFLDQASPCPFIEEGHKCCDVMKRGEIELGTFSKSVAHGIHSINVEQLNDFFHANVTENNNIPTTNLNVESENLILPYAPRMKHDADMLTTTMQLVDFIMTSNDDPNGFLNNRLTPLEKLVHHAHMNEMYARIQPLFKSIVQNPPQVHGLCECVSDEMDNGILRALRMYTVSFKAGDRDFRSSPETPNLLPKLDSSAAWKVWKRAQKMSVMSKNEQYNLALYLYCKLYEN